MATTLDNVSPLLDKYFTQKIHEVIWDAKESDPWTKYLVANSEATAGGNDGTIVVRVADDGDIKVGADIASVGGAIKSHRFEVTTSRIYWKAQVYKEELDATKGAPNGVFELTKRTLAGHARRCVQKLAMQAMTKRGALGVIKAKAGQVLTIGSVSTATGTTATLDLSILNRFRDGMILAAADNLLSGNLRGSPDTVTIDAGGINETNGEITVTGDLTNFAAGDYLFERLDTYVSRATRRVMAGAWEWCDYAAPASSENFFGKDRSLFPNLQATRFNATGMDYKAAILKARSKFKTRLRGGAPTVCFIPQDAYDSIEANIDRSMITTVELSKKGPGGSNVVIGVRGIEFSDGNGGSFQVTTCPFMENGLFLMGPANEAPFELAFTEKLVRIDNLGDMWRYKEVADPNGLENTKAYEATGDVRGAIYCTNPGLWLTGYNFFGAS